jgi:flagellar basal body-associated protein FliL
MKVKEREENKPRQNSNVLIIIVSFLLLASIGVSVVGLLNGKEENGERKKSELTETIKEEKSKSEEESLTELFQKEFTERQNLGREYLNDPFNEICEPARGDVPTMSSFTVCQP